MNTWILYQFALYAGALQGIILGISLVVNRAEKKRANRILALMLFLFSYRLILEALRSQGLVGVDSILYYFFLDYNWCYGALLYFYSRSYIERGFKFRKRDLLHFIPVFIEIIFSFYVKSQNFYWDGSVSSLSWFGNYSYQLWMHTPLQIIGVSLLIIFYALKIRKLLNVYTSDDSKPVLVEDIEWIRVVLTIYLTFSVILVFSALTDYLFFDFAFNSFYEIPAFLGLAVITYWLGLKGFMNRHRPYLVEDSPKPVSIPENSEQLLGQMEELMRVKELYKDSSLTLKKLSEELGIKSYQLTSLLNRVVNKNFTDYVNTFRVNEAKKLINSEMYFSNTLLSIALESGFNSKASFNRAVKKLEGKTPKELRDHK